MAGKRIAVLPLTTPDEPDEGWLGQGIADELIHALSWAEDLQIAPLAWSMRFDAGGDLKAIAARLKADALLAGEVKRDKDRVSLDARVVDAASGAALWQEHFDGTGMDLLDFQDSVLAGIVAALQLNAPAHLLSVKTGSTASPAAYERYLQGLNFFFRYAARNLRLALTMFEQAVKLDAGFARAWARLAECHAKYFMYYDAGAEHRDRALAAGRRAVERAPDFARAHTALGIAELINRNFAAAEDAFAKAAGINPRQFDAYYQHARACFQQGNLKKAAALFERAAQIQPDDYQPPLLLRQVYLSLGRVEDAKAAAQRGLAIAQQHLELNSKDGRAIYLACGSMIQLGMYQQAMAWAEKALAIDPDDPMINYNVACCYAQAGEPDKALDCLEKGKGSGMLEAGWLKNDSDLFSLHDHPRFQALLAELRANA